MIVAVVRVIGLAFWVASLLVTTTEAFVFLPPAIIGQQQTRLLPRSTTFPRNYERANLSSAGRNRKTSPTNQKGNKNKNKNKNKKNPTSTILRRPKAPVIDSSRLEENVFGYSTEERVLSLQKQRLEDSIDCIHYQNDNCPGCVVNQKISQVNKIGSSMQFFTSAPIYFPNYQFRIPSSIQQWRTQAKLVAANKKSITNNAGEPGTTTTTTSWSKTKNGCIFGLYHKGTHNVVSIPDCKVHHPAINKAISILEQVTEQLNVVAYNEETREGALRYVQLQVERTSQKICCTFIWNADNFKQTQPLLSKIVKSCVQKEPELFHSIWCHCNDSLGNNIFHRNVKRWYKVYGLEYVREPLPIFVPKPNEDEDTTTTTYKGYGWLYYTPQTFRQGNLNGFDFIAQTVAKLIPPKSKVCELYAGVGILGLSALAYHYEKNQPLQWLRCSDENPSNPRCFYKAVDSLPQDMVGKQSINYNNNKSPDEGITIAELSKRIAKEEQKNRDSSASFRSRQQPWQKNDKDDYTSTTNTNSKKITYRALSAQDALLAGEALGANVLIVDPPRKGLDEHVLAELCKPYNQDQPYVESITMLTMPDEDVNWTNDITTLIYVSCGFDSLARDTEKLLLSKTSSSEWILESATGYLLFPGSDHVETVCVFQRILS